MESDEIELIDYLRVIWKQKVFIIVGFLVCVVVTWVVSLRLPDMYRADALVSVGMIPGSSSKSSSLVPIDTPANLVKTIPVEYGSANYGKDLDYILRVEQANGTTLVSIILEGPNRRKVEEIIKGVVGKLVGDHLEILKRFIRPYKTLIEELEIDFKRVQKNLEHREKMLEQINININEEMGNINEEMGNINEEMGNINEEMNLEEVDPVLLMMIQNKKMSFFLYKESMARGITARRQKQSVDMNHKIQEDRDILTGFRDRLFKNQLIVDSNKQNATRLIGEINIKELPVRQKRYFRVLTAGVLGLIIFCFIAFLKE